MPYAGRQCPFCCSPQPLTPPSPSLPHLNLPSPSPALLLLPLAPAGLQGGQAQDKQVRLRCLR